MTKEELKIVSVWQTKLKLKDVDSEDIIGFIMNRYSKWVVTEFARNMKNEFLYVVQPVINSGYQEGVTGMSAFALTEDEFMNKFEIKNDVECEIQKV